MTNCLIIWLFVITMFSTASSVPYFKKNYSVGSSNVYRAASRRRIIVRFILSGA